ncbi:transmembrane protein [Stylonychia lemnae]|uniref:Transmembrane protein n=1 Tax=Stylonychia lemnae TaxID=5949 RepID=A0A078A494_STYLE|nr:transmembrane protein [Stylonychia lemnae]|eukprot:CDW77088.1 transmembrane protein [Stylonychia lemnae]
MESMSFKDPMMLAEQSSGYLKSIFRGTKIYDYDTRIDQYNWYALYIIQVAFYFTLQALVRKFAPPPGDIKVFKEKKKMNDYHFYYFQYPTFVHAIIGCIAGYRYDQPNHLYHQILMVHSFAYFTFDSIIEIYYGTDDALTNAHHLVVLIASFTHVKNSFGGFEYIVLHLITEISNPFLIIRTVLKICGMKETMIYAVNDMIFATIFLFFRMIVTPCALIYMFEGHNILAADKVGTAAILFIQLFWCYRILYLIMEKIRENYKDKTGAFNEPLVIRILFNIFKKLISDKKVKIYVSITQFILIFLIPYYFYKGTIFNNY